MEDIQVLPNEGSILLYLQEKYPEEGCGIILNKKGKLEWMACENEAEDKENDFKISGKDYIKAQLQGDIYAIVHSHPDAPSEPSEADKSSSNFLGIPYIIYSVPSCQKTVYIPELKEEPPEKYEAAEEMPCFDCKGTGLDPEPDFPGEECTTCDGEGTMAGVDRNLPGYVRANRLGAGNSKYFQTSQVSRIYK